MRKQIKEVNEQYDMGLITDIERIVKIQHIKYLWHTQKKDSE